MRVDLAKRLSRLRRDVRLEQEVVARALEIPRTAIVSIESGQRDVSASELLLFCKLYRVSPNELLGWKEPIDEEKGE